MSSKIVFMGSPVFALPTLKALATAYEVAGVVTQPDRPAGRGRQLTPPPVKQLAGELGVSVIQPPRLKEPGAMQQILAWQPDLIVVAAFGQILRPDVLELPRFGCINVHASLLPRWRGAAPIAAAILNGDQETGITIMKMDAGIDTGGILSQATEPILPDDTSISLADRLANLGAALLIKTLPEYLAGSLRPLPQDETKASYAPILKKENGLLDFNQTAITLDRQVRAYLPWPGAFMFWQGQPLKIHRTSVGKQTNEDEPANPGQFIRYQGYPAVQTRHGVLVLESLQPAGKRVMTGKAFLQGVKDW